MKILGIESSCDETGLAIYDSERGLLAHAIHSQIKTHQQFGGVVPELASRDHVRHIAKLTKEVLSNAKLTSSDIDYIAYTKGPGLVGALLVGAGFAKSLAYAWGIPAIGVHHMEGHLLAPFLEEKTPEFPFLALLVSGGHTQLMQVKSFGDYTLLGESLDDAAGEAFDKTAKLLGLQYPGGPLLAKLAENGIAGRFTFPRPMLDSNNLNFSFSGLKTHALNTIKKQELTEQTKADIAYAFEDAIVDTLIKKIARAIEQKQLQTIVIAGGVGANQTLRQRLTTFAKQEHIELFYPRLEFCTDNGAMIAYAGYQKIKRGLQDINLKIDVKPRWLLEE